MKLTKLQRAELYLKFGGRCAYCGCELPERWHADHVAPVQREWWKKYPKVTWELVDGCLVKKEEKQKIEMINYHNDVLENLFPSCIACNIDKHCMDLEGWRQVIANKVRVLRDNYKAFGHAERFGLVQEIKKPVIFWFEIFNAPDQDKGSHA